MNIDISKEQPGAVEPDTEESDATAAASSVDAAATDSTVAAEAESESAVADTEPPGDRPADSDDVSVSAATPPAKEPGRAPIVLTAVAVGALVVALVSALWFGAGWARSAFFTDAPRVSARDSALDAARQAAINMTTIRLEDIPGSLAVARSSMTGQILESAQKNQQDSERMATEAGVGMQSKVLGAALTTLNGENDKATALVVLQVTETRTDKSVSDYRYTWSLDMTKAGDVWKAEQVASLAQPVLLSGPGPTGLGQPAQQPGAAQPQPSEGAPAPQPGS